MCLLSISWSCHYQHSQHATHKRTFLDSLVIIRRLWFPLLSTSSLILTTILPSSWRVAIHSARYLKSSSLSWPSRKNVSEFDNPVDILLNHFAVLWDQHVNDNCPIQNGRIHFGQVTLVPISKQLVLQILCLTGQRWKKKVHSRVWRVNPDFHPWPDRLYRA